MESIVIQFDDIYRNYKGRIESFVRDMVRDTALTQDLTQRPLFMSRKG
jgi:hypothetical protein